MLTNSIVAEIPVLNRVPSTSSVTWNLNHHLVKGATKNLLLQVELPLFPWV